MKSKKVNWGHVIVFIILILCMIVTLLPFVWMILTSLKTGRVNLYSVKDISGKTVILKLCGSVYKDSICKNVFKYSCYGHCHRSSTVNPLLYGSICIWKNQISRKKYYFWNIACCTDGSIIFFYPATVSDDTENGIVKHNTGVIYTRIVQCFWNISDETVFYGTSERTGRCGEN